MPTERICRATGTCGWPARLRACSTARSQPHRSCPSSMPLINQIFGIDGKVALITGGYRGIGAAISLGLAEMGAKIAVTGIEGAQAAEFAAMVRGRGHDAYSALFDV